MDLQIERPCKRSAAHLHKQRVWSSKQSVMRTLAITFGHDRVRIESAGKLARTGHSVVLLLGCTLSICMFRLRLHMYMCSSLIGCVAAKVRTARPLPFFKNLNIVKLYQMMFSGVCQNGATWCDGLLPMFE